MNRLTTALDTTLSTELNAEQIQQLVNLAFRAGKCALDYYQGDIDVTLKSDESPVTQADLCISHLLEKNLPGIADFPVLSEENTPNTPQWQQWETYWLIDPIDGTKHFINRSGDFCVCIALIHRHRAVFGLIHAPTTDTLWCGQLTQQQTDDKTLSSDHKNATNRSGEVSKYVKSTASQTLQRHTITPPSLSPSSPPLAVTLSASTLSDNMATLLSALPDYTWYQRGSALKYIDIVEGKASLYPKMWDTCEWDSAAGHCLLVCLGGDVIRLDNAEPLTYGDNDSLVNPYFLAYRDLDTATLEQLRQRYQTIQNALP